VDEFDPVKWPRFVWFPAFLRDWERLGLDAEDLRSLELETEFNRKRTSQLDHEKGRSDG
jgi:hypothetical protein